jgi:hypothetical protein
MSNGAAYLAIRGVLETKPGPWKPETLITVAQERSGVARRDVAAAYLALASRELVPSGNLVTFREEPATRPDPAGLRQDCPVCITRRGRMFGGWANCRHGWAGQLAELEVETARLRTLLAAAGAD